MKIAIVSLYTNEIEDIVKLTASNQKKYADINGYDYILYKGRLSNRHPAWDKILAVKETLPNYDYVIWVDSDCIFKNFETKIEDIILDGYSGFFGKDPIDGIYVNTGVFILKNDKWSFDLLSKVWETHGKFYEDINIHSYNDWPYEQGPICKILKNNDVNHYIVPDYILNSHPSFDTPKTFILHFMGARANESTYKNTLKIIETHNKKLNIVELDPNEFAVKINNKFNKKGNIINTGSIDVNYNNIKGYIEYKIYDKNVICFEYSLPKDVSLSHVFKINNIQHNFNSDNYGCFNVPDVFSMYHSYDWFGNQDFKHIGDFNLDIL